MSKKKPDTLPQSEITDWLDEVQRALEMPDILPSLSFNDNEVKVVEFLEREPRIIEWKDEDGNVSKSHGITVRQLSDGAEYTMWLSSTSMRLGVAKLYGKNGGNLEHVTARIKADFYQHARFGKTRGYRVQQITSVEGNLEE